MTQITTSNPPVLYVNGREYTFKELEEELYHAGECGQSYPVLEKFASFCTLRFLDENGYANTKGAKEIAWHLYEGTARGMISSDHPSFWNDCFYISNRFGLDDLTKRRTAVIVVWNGRHKYFEWITHNGEFDNARLFADMGLITKEEESHYRESHLTRDEYYCFIDKHVEDRLVKKFGLAETELGSAHLLSPNIFHKERTGNYDSGQHPGLLWRPDIPESQRVILHPRVHHS